MIQWHFAKRNIFTGKVAWNSDLTHGLRHNCIIDQSATENKVIHTLIIDFFSHGLRSVKIEKELEKNRFIPLELFDTWHDMKLGYPGDLPEKPLRLMTGVITTFKVMEMFKVLVDCIQMKHIQSNLPMLSPPLSSHLY